MQKPDERRKTKSAIYNRHMTCLVWQYWLYGLVLISFVSSYQVWPTDTKNQEIAGECTVLTVSECYTAEESVTITAINPELRDPKQEQQMSIQLTFQNWKMHALLSMHFQMT